LYMVISLVLLGLLSIGLAYFWHKRMIGLKTLLVTVKSKFDDDEADKSYERGYAHCISHQWAVEYMARSKESSIGNSIRNFINDRTVFGFFVMGALIFPTTATIVVLFCRTFAFLGASVAVLIIAVFLIRTSDSVRASYGLLSWLRTRDASELKENDVAFVNEALNSLSNWRMKLIIIALLSLVAAPWGELIPQAVALTTSGFLITIFSLVYPPVSIISHNVAVIVVLYLIPFGIALGYLLFGSKNKVIAYLNGDLRRNL